MSSRGGMEDYQVAPSMQSFGPGYMNAAFLSSLTGSGQGRSGGGALEMAASAANTAKLRRADAQVATLNSQVEDLTAQNRQGRAGGRWL